jgi:hypothetical protein
MGCRTEEAGTVIHNFSKPYFDITNARREA